MEIEVTLEQIRFFIVQRFQQGDSATKIFDDLQLSLKDQAPSYSTVTNWIRQFKEGRTSLEDQERIGRPITVTTEKTIQQVRQIIDNDPYVTIKEIQEELEIGYDSVQRILTTELKLRRISNRFVPHELTNHDKRQRLEICYSI